MSDEATDSGLAGALHETLQTHPPVDGAVLMGWIVVAEYRTPDEGDWLSKRSGDAMGEPLRSWREHGYLFSALHTEWADDAEEDEDEA